MAMTTISKFPCQISLSSYFASTKNSLHANTCLHHPLVYTTFQRFHVLRARDSFFTRQDSPLAPLIKGTIPRTSITMNMNELPSTNLVALSIASSRCAVSNVEKQALILVFNDKNLDSLAKGLDNLGYKLVSTCSTATTLEKIGCSITRIEELLPLPLMPNMHPSIRGNILARQAMLSYLEALQDHGLETMNVVLIVNLQPLYNIGTSSSGNLEASLENMDTEGQSMIRIAAKNYKDVVVVVDPDDYSEVLAKLRDDDCHKNFRSRLASKALQYTSKYDSMVSEWLQNHERDVEERIKFPPSLTLNLSLKSELRYGENLHQRAAIYVETNPLYTSKFEGIENVIQLHGTKMSYNNYLDIDAAWNCACDFKSPTCVIVKHTNPCGIASVDSNDSIVEAYHGAVKGDPISAYGGSIAFNTEVDENLAREIREFRNPTDGGKKMFYDNVVALGYTPKGLEILKGKSKTLRILEAKQTTKAHQSFRQFGSAGWLVQDFDDKVLKGKDFELVTSKDCTLEQLQDALFAWKCCKYIKSNAIVLAKNNQMLGMGSGQPNRAKSLQIALEKSGDKRKGAALASDAFFPFAWGDAIEEACKAGVNTIVQPGGSKRDQDAIDCCNQYAVTMFFTRVRHFLH